MGFPVPGLLADAYLKTGRLDDAREALTEASTFVEHHGEPMVEFELHRLQGELWIALEREDEALVSLWEAIQVARYQRAKSRELRATVSLARLLACQRRYDSASAALAHTLQRFTEGLKTPELQEASALLRELAPR